MLQLDSTPSRVLVRLLSTTLLLALMAPVRLAAQAHDMGRDIVGRSATGLPGLDRTGVPRMEPGFSAAASAGYGYTEATGPVGRGVHRAAASLAAAVAPLPYLAFALRLDGRLDFHGDDGGGAHTTAVGDPRLYARFGHALSQQVQLGAELGLWFPGNSAPSFVPSATTADGRALFSFATGPWTLLGAAGFRLDRSASSAPDLSRMRSGDRLVLGLSDENAVLLALGAARMLTRHTQVFGELSADLLVGADAPKPSRSPARVVLGARQGLSDVLAVELSATLATSRRPPLQVTDPLVPVEPRFLVMAGLRYGFRFEGPPPRAPVEVEPDLPPVAPTATVGGQLLDDQGRPLPEALLTLTDADGGARESIADAEGRYRFDDVPHGPAELEIRADGFEPLSLTLDVADAMGAVATQTLVPQAPAGVLRGLARSFESEPLPARVRVLDRRGRQVAEVTAAEDGRFEIELPPGQYRVSIELDGYRGQRRRVRIEDQGVTILNADLRQ